MKWVSHAASPTGLSSWTAEKSSKWRRQASSSNIRNTNAHEPSSARFPDRKPTFILNGVADVKPDLLLVEPMMQVIEARLEDAYKVHRLYDPAQRQTIEESAGAIRAVVTGGGTGLGND